MASGSTGRGNSASKGFDFASDDILCSYDDYGTQDSSNGNHSDPVMGTNSTKPDFHKTRMTRTSMFPATTYSPPEDSLSQDVIATVEKSMKKYADNLMRFLEGISSRLSQLELYCYNLDKSIGEMRSDLNRSNGEAESKLKYLDKHLQEVHRSVQILRDKQELADTQKELAKLQLVQKESSSSSHTQSNEERSSPSATDPKKTDSAPDTHNQQLALALPHQVAPQQQAIVPHSQAAASNVTQATQQPPYYMAPTPVPNPQTVAQLPQNQYLPSDPQYRSTQLPSQITQTPPVQQYPQYQQAPPPAPQPPQQQRPQQLPPQQVQPPQPQPPSMQPQMRPPSSVYPSYPPSQATNQSPPETLPNSMPMQMPYSGIPPPGSSRADTMPYGYGGGRTVPQQPPPQQMKGSFPAPPSDAYGTTGTHPALPPASGYMIYEGEGGRTHPPPPHYAQSGYPPASASLQNPTGRNLMVRSPSPPQFVRNHPYNELIEKLTSMGFRGDHVASVIQRMEETGQPIDFNSVLDRLNVHGPVVPQRGWSG